MTIISEPLFLYFILPLTHVLVMCVLSQKMGSCQSFWGQINESIKAREIKTNFVKGKNRYYSDQSITGTSRPSPRSLFTLSLKISHFITSTHHFYALSLKFSHFITFTTRIKIHVINNST